ncbi:hypothetical protein CR513_22350, partial [Mucuna pruriens]
MDTLMIDATLSMDSQTKLPMLATHFEMKESGKLKYFFGIVVAYSKKGILISQRKYVLDLLTETRKLGCKTTRVAIEQNHKIGSEESPPIEKSRYKKLA